MKIGCKIRELRKERGMTQEEVGKYLGVKKSAVQKYENGSIQNLKFETIRKLCSLFEIYPWELIYTNEEENKLRQEMLAVRVLSLAYGSETIEMLEMFTKLSPKNQDKVIEIVNAMTVLERIDTD